MIYMQFPTANQLFDHFRKDLSPFYGYNLNCSLFQSECKVRMTKERIAELKRFEDEVGCR